jgi:hypothetical protein
MQAHLDTGIEKHAPDLGFEILFPFLVYIGDVLVGNDEAFLFQTVTVDH